MTLMETLSHATTELFLVLSAMVLLIVGVFLGDKYVRHITLASVGVLLVGILLVALGPQGQGVSLFEGAFKVDGLAAFAKIFVLGAAAVTILMSGRFLVGDQMGKFEFPVLVVLAAFGMSLMVSSTDLISLYMGVETKSLALYILAAFNRDSRRSTEAGLKYFVLGALSSCLLLYGASLIYGFSGSTLFSEIAKVAVEEEPNVGLILSLIHI